MPPAPPTELQRKQAALLDRDRAGLEKIGIEAARRIGQRVRLASLRAFRRGDDPLPPAREQLATMRDLLADAMVAAYLKGLRRVELTVQRQQKIKLSTAYDGAIEHLRRQALLRPEDLDELRDRFGNDVAKVLGELTNAVDGRLMNTMTDLTIRQAHVAEGIADLKDAFHRSGIDPANSYMLENIFRTQTQIAYAAGRWQALEEPAIDEILWGFTYVTVGDNRVRANHVAMDGIRLPKEDPFWSRFFPPNGYSCRCAAIEIFEGDALARRSRIVTPKPKRVDGATVFPDADPGFDFNPGQLFAGAIASGSSGTPVLRLKHPRSLLSVARGGPVTESVSETLNAIGKVHAIPREMLSIPVHVTRSHRTVGGYASHRVTGEPLFIRISRNGLHKHMTTAHELGHYFDHHGIGINGVFDSESGGGPIQKVIDAISQSSAYRQLVQERESARLMGRRRQLTHVNYLLERKELFARSYAQFIALESGSVKMKHELDVALSTQSTARQWRPRDFAPIHRAFRELIGELKWTN